MEHLSYQSRPDLRRPVLVAGFEGWSDAGEAATSAIAYLREQWKAQVFATIDPEDFFDFQAHRPLVSLDPDGMRRITWPTVDFAHAAVPGADRDAILLRAIEPSTKWRTFTETVVDVATANGVSTVVLLGALLAGRPHTRPTRITGTASTPELAARYGFTPPRYEGPTGMVGVLMDAFRAADIETITLWAWVPHYVQGSPSPKAALGLLRNMSTVLQLGIDLSDLEARTRTYETKIDEAVQADPDIVATVQELERRADEEDMQDIPSGEELAAEVERFLRDQPPER